MFMWVCNGAPKWQLLHTNQLLINDFEDSFINDFGTDFRTNSHFDHICPLQMYRAYNWFSLCGLAGGKPSTMGRPPPTASDAKDVSASVERTWEVLHDSSCKCSLKDSLSAGIRLVFFNLFIAYLQAAASI
jgi:hypothetical protein